jgi:hypothetical protein
MRIFPRERAVRMGLALSGTEMWATWDGVGAARRTLRVPVTPIPAENGSWPGLARAFEEVRAATGAGGHVRIAVALLPPLVEVRRLEVPPLAESDLLRLLARNGARYFMRARGPQVVGVVAPPSRSRDASSVLAAAAPTRVVDALHDAARAVGWTVSSVTPAEAAWVAAARELWPGLARGRGDVLVQRQGRTTLVEIGDGRCAGVRHFRAGAADAALVAEAVAPTAGGTTLRLGAFGMSATDEVKSALGERGIGIDTPPESWQEEAATPEVLAAAFAGRAPGPFLWSERTRAERHARVRRATYAVAAAAGVLFAAAGAARLWGVERQLGAVKAERTAIRPAVAATLVGQMSVEDASREIAALSGVERNAPRWAPVLAELSAGLPRDAYLSGFHTRGDSLTVDGLAASASRAFDVMEASPHLADVHVPAPVRRESQQGGPPMERFTIAAVLRRGEGAEAHLPATTMHPAADAVATGGGRR